MQNLKGKRREKGFNYENWKFIEKTGELIAKTYFLGRRQTKKTKKLSAFVEKNFPTENKFEALNQILKFITTVRVEKDENVKRSVFRKRNAEQVLEDEYLTGCSDGATLFAGLANAKGIPVILVDTVAKKQPSSTDFSGHAFADVFVDGKWITVEPIAGKIVGKGRGYHRINNKGETVEYLQVARGRDFETMRLADFDKTIRTGLKALAKYDKKKQ